MIPVCVVTLTACHSSTLPRSYVFTVIPFCVDASSPHDSTNASPFYAFNVLRLYLLALSRLHRTTPPTRNRVNASTRQRYTLLSRHVFAVVTWHVSTVLRYIETAREAPGAEDNALERELAPLNPWQSVRVMSTQFLGAGLSRLLN